MIYLKAPIEEAEKMLSSNTKDDGPPFLSILVVLLKAQYFYSVGQVCNLCTSSMIH